ncbi:MAG: hypothetical protein PHU85_09460 [Phycisphaerae bacterium]|nr:hypothetical protein [Phycisphaerae bacterium]
MRHTWIAVACLLALVGLPGCYEVSRGIQGIGNGAIYIRETTSWTGFGSRGVSSDRYVFDVRARKWTFPDQKTMEDRMAAAGRRQKETMALCRRARPHWDFAYDATRDGCWVLRPFRGGEVVFVSREMAERLTPSTQPDFAGLRVWHCDSLNGTQGRPQDRRFLFDGDRVCMVTGRPGRRDGVLLVQMDMTGDRASANDTDTMGTKAGTGEWTYSFWSRGQALLDGYIYYVDQTRRGNNAVRSALVRRKLDDPNVCKEVTVLNYEAQILSLDGHVVVTDKAGLLVIGRDGKVKRYWYPDRGAIGRGLLNVGVAPARNAGEFLLNWPYLFMTGPIFR